MPNCSRANKPAHRLVRALGRRAALCALAVSMAHGCASREPWQTEDPKEALEAFVTALYFDRGDLAWHFLTPATQEAIEARAATINREAGAKVVEPRDLISRIGFLGPHQIAAYDVRDGGSEDRVTIVVRTQLDEEHEVSMVRVDEIWRVDGIELPDVAAAREAPVPPTAPPAPPTGPINQDTPALPEVETP